MPVHLLIINLCKFILRACIIESYLLHHGCPLMHICNYIHVWLLLVFVVDDVFLSMYNSIRTTTLKGLIVLGHVASIVMPCMHSSLCWNGVMYTAIVFCYVHMVTSTVYKSSTAITA